MSNAVFKWQPGADLLQKWLPQSLLARTLLIIGTPLLLVQVIAALVFYDRHYESTIKRLSRAIAGEVAVIIQLVGEDPEQALESGELELVKGVFWFEITFEPGGMLPHQSPASHSSLLDLKLKTALQKRSIYPFRIDTLSLGDVVSIQVQLADGVMEVRVPRKRLVGSTTYILFIWVVGSSLVLFVFATYFMRNQVKPIRRLAEAAKNFGCGIDDPEFEPAGAAEVRLAATSFLQMRDRIRRQIEQRTFMLAGVSHDLRTPLTRMKLQLAMAREIPEVANLASDVIEMEQMVEGYLAFAASEDREDPKSVLLSKFLGSVVEQMSHNGAKIDLQLGEDVEVMLRPAAMRRCLANLLSNALRHSARVEVRAHVVNKSLEITIDDDGPGIPADRRADAFKPFYRLDKSRNPKTGGTGLGLTIARDVVRGHGGDLTLADSPLGGLRARICVPI